MKRKFLKALFMFMFVIPFTLFFAACGSDDDDSPETTPVSVTDISVILAENSELDYNAETNTISFEYGTEIALQKNDFVVTAIYEDETSGVVGDYSIDLGKSSGILDVGKYEATFSYKNKDAKVNIKVYPKAIDKPTELQLVTILKNNSESVREYAVGDIVSTIYRMDRISGYENIYEFRIAGFDASMINFVDGSVSKTSQAGEYQVVVEPTKNYVWKEFDESQTEKIAFDWKIEKSSVYMSSPESLLFEYDGEVKTINFINKSMVSNFADYFEIIEGTVSASEKGKYSFTVGLNELKKNNYSILETVYKRINASGIGDFEYNEDRTEITYYWEIV